MVKPTTPHPVGEAEPRVGVVDAFTELVESLWRSVQETDSEAAHVAHPQAAQNHRQ